MENQNIMKTSKQEKNMPKKPLHYLCAYCKNRCFYVYWKKDLLFFAMFMTAYVFSVNNSAMSVKNIGFPISYYSWNAFGPDTFSFIFFAFDIIFWYLIAIVIIKKPKRINRNTTFFNYAVFVAVLFLLFYQHVHMWK